MKLGRPLLTTDMSGSLGGMVAAKARGGLLYIRSRVNPSNPRSGAQSRVRLILSDVSAAWRNTLDASMRAAWTALAGATESGIDVFVKVNTQLVLYGTTRADTPLESATLDASPPSAIVVDASAHTITITPTTFGDDIKANVFVSVRRQKASRLARQFPYTFLGGTPLDDASPVSLNFNTIPGLVGAVAGDIIYVRVVQLDVNGKVALPFEQRCVVVA